MILFWSIEKQGQLHQRIDPLWRSLLLFSSNRLTAMEMLVKNTSNHVSSSLSFQTSRKKRRCPTDIFFFFLSFDVIEIVHKPWRNRRERFFLMRIRWLKRYFSTNILERNLLGEEIRRWNGTHFSSISILKMESDRAIIDDVRFGKRERIVRNDFDVLVFTKRHPWYWSWVFTW